MGRHEIGKADTAENVDGGSSNGAAGMVDRINFAQWSPLNRQRLQRLLDEYGSSSSSYNPSRRPYAVFDWDNTCIMNDSEEALLMYQANNLMYQLTPEEFAAVLRQGVPNGAFAAELGYQDVNGRPVQMEDIAADVEADYRWLYCNYQGLQGDRSLEEIQRSEQFKDFVAKLHFMYDAICGTHPLEVGYKWIIYFYCNMSKQQLQAMAAACNDHCLAEPLRKEQYQSSSAMPGKAGVISTSHFHGMRIHEDMRDLMHVLRANGIDVYISTASIDDVVRVFAGHPRYGYDVPEQNVIGLKLEIKDGKYTSVYKKDWHFNWGPGKTIGIRNELQAQKGYGPILIAGDSDGDAWMLRDFTDTSLGIVINRMQNGEIGAVSKLAAALIGDPDARFVLQGRDEHTGQLHSDEKTMQYGNTESVLLA